MKSKLEVPWRSVQKAVKLKVSGVFYALSSQNEHLKETKNLTYMEKLPFQETTITWELKSDRGFED